MRKVRRSPARTLSVVQTSGVPRLRPGNAGRHDGARVMSLGGRAMPARSRNVAGRVVLSSILAATGSLRRSGEN